MADDASRDRRGGAQESRHSPLGAQSDYSGPHQPFGSYGETSPGAPRYGGSVPGYGSHGMGYGPQSGTSGLTFGVYGAPREMAADYREGSRAGSPGEFDQPHGQVGHGWEGSFGSEGDFSSFADPAAERPGGLRRRPGPKNYRRSDEKISDDICERLTREKGVDASDVNVEVKGGVVTLTGTVSERRMKHRIEDTVADTPHVADVDNRVRVESAS